MLRLALENQRFAVRVQSLAVWKGELSAVIAKLMSNMFVKRMAVLETS